MAGGTASPLEACFARRHLGALPKKRALGRVLVACKRISVENISATADKFNPAGTGRTSSMEEASGETGMRKSGGVKSPSLQLWSYLRSGEGRGQDWGVGGMGVPARRQSAVARA